MVGEKLYEAYAAQGKQEEGLNRLLGGITATVAIARSAANVKSGAVSQPKQLRTAIQATPVSFGVILTFAILGGQILRLLHILLFSFAGGNPPRW